MAERASSGRNFGSGCVFSVLRGKANTPLRRAFCFPSLSPLMEWGAERRPPSSDTPQLQVDGC